MKKEDFFPILIHLKNREYCDTIHMDPSIA